MAESFTNYSEALHWHEKDGGWLLRHDGKYLVLEEDEAIAMGLATTQELEAREKLRDWADEPYSPQDLMPSNDTIALERWKALAKGYRAWAVADMRDFQYSPDDPEVIKFSVFEAEYADLTKDEKSS